MDSGSVVPFSSSFLLIVIEVPVLLAQILQQICRGGEAEISIGNFSLFLFPANPKAKAMEAERMKGISERVMIASTKWRDAALSTKH